MIYNQENQTFEYQGQQFSVGGIVYVNSSSQYYGLLGTIEEIRTGSDTVEKSREIELYCDLCEPVLQADKERIHKILQPIDGWYKNIVLSPSEIILNQDNTQKTIKREVVLLVEHWNYHGEGEKHRIRAFFDREATLRTLRFQLDAENEDGMIKEYKEENFVVEETENSYEIYVSDEYCYNHYSIYVEVIEETQ